jgi:PKD repeat protein
MAATSVIVALAYGCGDDGPSDVGTPPVAGFTQTCADLVCTFDDTSTPEADITAWSWNFGDNTSPENTSDVRDPVHTFTQAGEYSVTLTVTHRNGLTDAQTNAVIVTQGTTGAPTADFTFTCASLTCQFTDASTDVAPGTIASWSWDFDDGSAPMTERSPTHTYVATEPNTFNVKLTVTDNEGNIAEVTKPVPVAPPAGLECDNGAGTLVSCTLDIEQRSTVEVTMTSNNCTAQGNRLEIIQPIQQVIFNNGCRVAPGTVFRVNFGTPFDAGTQLQAQMTSGSQDPNRIAPQLRVTGDFPTWTLEFDDGENPTGPGEPDFNDIVLRVQATVVP